MSCEIEYNNKKYTVSEFKNYMADNLDEFKLTEDLNKFKEWMSKSLPQLKLEIYDKLIDGKAWGQFYNGIIKIYNKSAIGTGFHEAFEAVWNSYLEENVIKELIDEFRNREGSFFNEFTGESKLYKNANYYDVKEMLAEEFIDYMQENNQKAIPSAPTRNTFFRKLYNFIKQLLGLSIDEHLDLGAKTYELFSNIKEGKFANKEDVNNFSLTVNNRNKINHVDTEYSRKVLEGMTVIFFQLLYSSKDKDGRPLSITSLFNPNNNSSLFEDLYKETANHVTRHLKNLAGKHLLEMYPNFKELSKEKQVELYNDYQLKQGKSALIVINKLNTDVKEKFQKYISQFGFSFKPMSLEMMYGEEAANMIADKESETSDTLGILNAIYIDPRQMTNSNVKLLIASLATEEYSPVDGIKRVTLNDLNLPSLEDYGRKLNILLNELHSLVPVEKFEKGQRVKYSVLRQMFNKLDKRFKYNNSQYRKDLVWIDRLKDRLKLKDLVENPESLSQDEIQLLIAFENSFNKNKNNPLKLIIGEDNRLYDTDPVVVQNSKKIREKWINNAKNEADKTFTKDTLIKIGEDGKILIDKESGVFKTLKERLSKKESLSQYLYHLSLFGIEFTNRDLILREYPSLVETIRRDYLDIIVSKIDKGEIKTIEDLFGKQIVNSTINKLIDLEIETTQEDTILSHQTAEGKSQYSVTLPSAASHFVNSYKAVSHIRDFILSNPHLGRVDDNGNWHVNAYSKGSHLLEKMFDKNGNKNEKFKFDYVYILGASSELDSVGKNTDRMAFPDKVVQEIHHLLKGIYYSIINSDKTSEFGFSMGSFIGIDALRVPFRDPNHKLYTLYRESLKDEIFAANREVRNPTNIKEFSESITKLGHFRSIVYDKLSDESRKKLDDIIKDKTNKDLPISVNTFVNSSEVTSILFKYFNDKLEEHKDWLVDLGIFKKQLKGQDSSGKDVYDYYSKAISSEHLTNLFGPTISKNKEGDYVFDSSIYKTLVGYLIFNRQLAVFEQHKLMYGHPNLYKDLAKRTSALNSQKQQMSESPEILAWYNANMKRFDGKERNNKFTWRTYADPIVASNFYKIVIEGIYKDMVKQYGSTFNATIKSTIEKRIGAKFNDDGTVNKLLDNFSKTVVDAYLGCNESDGGSFIMPDFYRDILFLSSKITQQQLDLLEYENALEIVDRYEATDNKFNIPGYIDKSDLNAYNKAKEFIAAYKPTDAILQVLKPHGFGYNSTEGMTHAVLLKQSVVPITWSRAKDNPNMLKRYLQAKKDKQDLIGFEGAQKVGVLLSNSKEAVKGLIPLYDKTGASNEILPPMHEMGTKYYGLQVDMSDHVKDSVILGSQMKKINLTNLPKHLKSYAEEYNTLLDSLTKKAYQEVLSELGLKKDGNDFKVINYTRLVKSLKEELEKRDLPDNVLDTIATVNNGLKLEYLFDASPIREKIDNILNAMVDNRVVAQKVFGKASVQMPFTLFEKENRTFVYLKNGVYEKVDSDNINTLSKEELSSMKLTSSDLKFYRPDSSTGQTLTMEVYVPWFFEGIDPLKVGFELVNGIYMPKDGKSVESILKSVGFRIPTQGMNSIEAISIKGFLDSKWGDSVIVPTEIVAKSGSDFDIDKMNLLFKNYFKKDNKLQEHTLDLTEEGVKKRYNKYINSMLDKVSKQYINTLKNEYYQATLNSLNKKEQELIDEYNDLSIEDKKILNAQLIDLNTIVENNTSLVSIYDLTKIYSKKLFKKLSEETQELFYTSQANSNTSHQANLELAKQLMGTVSKKDSFYLKAMLPYYNQLIVLKQAIDGKVLENENNIDNQFNKFKDDSFKDLQEVQFEVAEEEAINNNLLSFEEFKKLPILDQNTREAVHNRLIDVMHTILLDPDNFRQLTTPNGSDTAKRLADKIKKAKGLSDSERDRAKLSEFKTMAQTREAYATGKKLVGIIALQITSHTLSQYGDVELSGTYKYQSGKPIPVTIKLKHTSNMGKLALNLVHDQDYMLISELISEAMTGAVDAAKDPFIFDLNLTIDTASTWFYLQKLGVPIEDLAYLHNQPAIIEYFKESARNNSFVNSVNDDKLFKSDLFYKVASSYIQVINPNIKNYAGLLDQIAILNAKIDSEEFGSPKFREFSKEIRNLVKVKKDLKKDIDAVVNGHKASISEYKTEDLFNNIKNLNEKDHKLTKEEALNQLALLKDYLDYKEQSNYFSNFINALSYDTARTKNIAENLIQASNYKKAINDGFITEESIKRVFDKTFLKGLKDIKDSVPTMFKDLFVFLHPKSDKVRQLVVDRIENDEIFQTKDDKAEFINRFQNFYVNYLLHTIAYKKGKTLNQYYKLFFNNGKYTSLSEELKNIQQSPKYIDNKALQALFPLLNNDVKDINNIKLFQNKMSTYEINSFSESLAELREDAVKNGDRQLEEFLVKLGMFTILQSGVQQSPLTYTKILPIELYSKLVKSILDNFTESNIEVNADLVWEQFHQNNFTNGDLVKRVYKPKYSLIKDKDGVTIVKALTVKRDSLEKQYDYLTVKTVKEEFKKNPALKQEYFKNKRGKEVFNVTLYRKEIVEDAFGTNLSDRADLIYYLPINTLGNGMYMIEAYDNPGKSARESNNVSDYDVLSAKNIIKELVMMSNMEEVNSDTNDIYSKLSSTSDNLIISNIRTDKGSYNRNANLEAAKLNNRIYSMETENDLNFSNPWASFNRDGTIKTNNTEESVKNYIDWLTTDKFKNIKPERREWILKQLKLGVLKNKPIQYYVDLGEPSHAVALDYLINKYDWSNNPELPKSSNKTIEITNTLYTKQLVKDNPNVGYVFTENTYSIIAFPNKIGGGSAVIRPEPNSFGIVTKKKYDYNTKENVDYKDTESDFKEFVEINTKLINKIKNSNYKKLVFPQGFATDKATLPTRFALWLQKALLDNFGLVTELNNTKTGLITKGVNNQILTIEPEGLPKIENNNINNCG